jgi:hypothetical protein
VKKKGRLGRQERQTVPFESVKAHPSSGYEKRVLKTMRCAECGEDEEFFFCAVNLLLQ